MTFGDLEKQIKEVATANFIEGKTIKGNPELELIQANDVKRLEDIAESCVKDMKFAPQESIRYIRQFEKMYSTNRLRKLKLKILNEK
jgi:hypothetical protein